jgi:hypothetical protein
MRYTKEEVKLMFGRLAKAMRKSTRIGDENRVILDYVSCYGGYVIEQEEKDGGISHPFGCMRRSSKEMYLSMLMAAQALEDQRYKQELLNKYEGA